MARGRRSNQNQAVRRSGPKQGGYSTFMGIMVILSVVGFLVGYELFLPGVAEKKRPEIKIAAPVPTATSAAPTVSADVILNSQSNALPTRDPLKFRVGIVSGHKDYDSGAVCDDGLTEAEINYTIALEVVGLLERRGDIQVDFLTEFDDRLTDYQANALVSVHADSCNVPGASGFKVARVTNSAIPEAEDRLVACITEKYAEYTALPEHQASITDNMTNYHAFNEIAPLTPGAIIEAGFLLDDRQFLVNKPKIAARGIAAGILCFLDASEP